MEVELNTLKALCKNRAGQQIVNLISGHPEVLNQHDETGSTGFLIIAYSFLPEAFARAKELKKDLTFHEAVVAGNSQKVQQEIAADKHLANAFSPDGFSPLSLAAFFGQTEIARYLLAQGADPNLAAKNASGVNALHSAVAREDYDLCVLFIEAGADVNAVQMQNVSALHSATHRGNLPLVKLLIENGAVIDHAMDNGDTAVSIAQREGQTDVERYLKEMLASRGV